MLHKILYYLRLNPKCPCMPFPWEILYNRMDKRPNHPSTPMDIEDVWDFLIEKRQLLKEHYNQSHTSNEVQMRHLLPQPWRTQWYLYLWHHHINSLSTSQLHSQTSRSPIPSHQITLYVPLINLNTTPFQDHHSYHSTLVQNWLEINCTFQDHPSFQPIQTVQLVQNSHSKTIINAQQDDYKAITRPSTTKSQIARPSLYHNHTNLKTQQYIGHITSINNNENNYQTTPDQPTQTPDHDTSFPQQQTHRAHTE